MSKLKGNEKHGAIDMLFKGRRDQRKRAKPLNDETVEARLAHIERYALVKGMEVSSPGGPGKIKKIETHTGYISLQVYPTRHRRHGEIKKYPATAVTPA